MDANASVGIVEVKNNVATKLADYTALKSQLAKVTPSNTAMADYKVTNTAAAACPATGTAWRSSEKLPPAVSPALCECMVKSLSCVAADNLSGEEIGELFGLVCGLDEKSCAGVARNPQTGIYGAYSMCSGQQQVSFVVDQYYKNQKQAKDACDFNGKAKTQQGSTQGTCDTLVKAAGTAGTNTVAASAAGTGSTSGSTGTSSGNAAVGTVVPQFNVGMLTMSLYVIVAGLTGAGMILL